MSEQKPQRAADDGSPRDEGWPVQPNARWPRRCLIENVAIHPSRPWLAAACTADALDARDESEQGPASSGEAYILVFDAELGTIRTATQVIGEGDSAGWSENKDLLRWHPDGRRLAANMGLNGIGLFENARFVGVAFPDETRDSGVGYVWVGDRIFADTGALFELHPGDRRFDLSPMIGAPAFEEIEWNAAIGAVVGRVGNGIAAFDPVRGKLVYQVPMGDLPASFGMDWSSDGRSCARRHPIAPNVDEVVFFDGDDGRRIGSVTPSLPRTRTGVWAPDGSLFVMHTEGGREPRPGKRSESHVDLVRGGRLVRTLDLASRLPGRSHSIPETSALAPTPAGDAVAILLEDGEVRVHDAKSGALRAAFAASTPGIPAGLPDYYRGYPSVPQPVNRGGLLWVTPDRLVQVAPHFIAFFTPDGKKLAEFVVPDR
ncbi:MAG: hypothetical protein OZ921_01720 [Sorangiineae bacterium]|nr:hypothetical protein [Polyangiaceae bacterium]MEB2321201.1 hypothetical protein [Sorangiineae bacterium]